MIVASIIAAIIPAALYTGIIYWVDRYEKEPLWLLATAFLWGAIPSIIFALIFNEVFGFPFYVIFGAETGDALVATLVAPFVEELIKAAVLFIILFWWRHQIDSLLDGIIYGAVAGMGFAMVENVFYFEAVFAQEGIEGWQANIFLRAIIFGFNHSLYTAMSGLGIAIARLTKHRFWRIVAPIVGISLAMFLHFMHNGLASFGYEFFGDALLVPLLFNAWGGVSLTVLIIIGTLWQERRWIRSYLKEEVSAGVLTESQFSVVSSNLGRFGKNWQMLFSRGMGDYFKHKRFLSRCSKLAYLKHHQDWYHDAESKARILELRKEIYMLSQSLI